jgi:hypothetical protein
MIVTTSRKSWPPDEAEATTSGNHNFREVVTITGAEQRSKET